MLNFDSTALFLLEVAFRLQQNGNSLGIGSIKHSWLASHGLGSLVLVPPGAFKQFIDPLHVNSGSFWNSEESVEKCKNAPSGEEEESAPVISTREQ